MKNKQLKNKKAFSMMELSLVIVIVGLIIAGITQSSRMIGAMRLSAARGITKSAPVATIPNLLLWLEPTSERSLGNVNSGYDFDNGDSIQTWYDINPQVSEVNRKHFAAPASNKRPTYVSTGIGNLPSVQFSRSLVRYFENTNGVLDVGDATYTIFAVAKIVTFAGGAYYFTFGQNTSPATGTRLASIVYSGTSGIGLATAGSDYYVAPITSNRVVITGGTMNGTTATVYNNTLTGSSGAIGSASGVLGTIARVGVAPYNETEMFDGLISEIIVYDRVLRIEEINAIMTYLSKKYGVRLS